MPDSIPSLAWALLLLATIAIGPVAYLWRHFTHDLALRDITQPPPDLTWRSTRQLYLSIATVAGLLVVAGIAFTSFAGDIARSDAFVPAVLGALGSYALGTAINGWRTERIEPLVRGASRAYDRSGEPVRYWASLAWNSVLGVAMLAASLGVLHERPNRGCDDSDDHAQLVRALESCNSLLSAGSYSDEGQADLLAARGRVHHRLGNDARAIADYSNALLLDPDDSFTLYNRGVVYQRTRNLPMAIKDFSDSLELRPDNDEAYLMRGNAYLDMGNMHGAIADFTTLAQRDPKNPYAVANRRVAYAWLNSRELAERDFAAVPADAPGAPIALRGRAILARQQGDYTAAIDYLTQSLALDPDNAFILRMRGDLYWETGHHDLARDDDDRLMEIESRAAQAIR